MTTSHKLGKDLVIGKEITEDIFAMLIFDFPHSILNVQPDQAKKWGCSIEQLFEIGINNIKQNYPVKISEQKVGEFKIWFVQGDHFFTPNIIYNFNRNPKLIGSKGSLIGLPHRHSILIYPIENIEIVKAINMLTPIIHGMNNEGPGSLSNKLYWYKDGEFMNLPYKLAEKKLQFFPSDKFLELLNGLKSIK